MMRLLLEPSAMGALGVLVRVTMIAALGTLALALLPRLAAASRHMIAMATLAAILALPAIAVLVPAWTWRVLPTSLTIQPVLLPIAMTPPVIAASTFPVAERRAVSSRDLDDRNSDRSTVTLGDTEGRPSRRSPVPWPGASAALLITWLAGALVLWARLAASVLDARAIARGATLVVDPALLRVLEHARARLGIEANVRLATTPRMESPGLIGWLDPMLVLPRGAEAWDPDRLEAVFLHELGHLQRRDGLATLLAQIVTGLFWFHPLVWHLARIARRECERSCDDLVLLNGVRASEYARHLVAIASDMLRDDPFVPATMAFAVRSHLERRVTSIVGVGVRRERATRGSLVIALAAIVLLVLPLASVRLDAAPVPVSLTRALLMEPVGDRVVADEGDRSKNEAVEYAPQAKTEESQKTSDLEVTYPPQDSDGGSATVGSRSGSDWFSEAHDAYQTERYESAAIAYENAARAGYRIDTALYNAACSYALAKHADPALSALERALEAGFDEPKTIAADGDLDILRSDPRFEALLKHAMSTPAADVQRRQARAEYDALVSSRPNDSGQWNSVGVDLMRAGDHEHAVIAFERAIRIDGSATALYNLGCAYALHGDRDQALDVLERAILDGAGDPGSDADLRSLRGDPRFEQLVRLDEDLTLYGKGMTEDKPNVWKQSLPRFERVTREHPKLGRAWSNLGYAQLKSGNPRAAQNSFRRALQLGYRQKTTLYNLACSASRAGDRDNAFMWLGMAEKAGMDLPNYVTHDRDLDPLRSDPRFRPYLDRSKVVSAEKHASKSKSEKSDKD